MAHLVQHGHALLKLMTWIDPVKPACKRLAHQLMNAPHGDLGRNIKDRLKQ